MVGIEDEGGSRKAGENVWKGRRVGGCQGSRGDRRERKEEE